MSGITTHILDTSIGRPAAGVKVRLHGWNRAEWELLGEGFTDADGRLRTLLASDHTLTAGRYRLVFETAAYFHARAVASFYPEVSVVFEVTDASQHFHVPLLLNPFGYSTYRGS